MPFCQCHIKVHKPLLSCQALPPEQNQDGTEGGQTYVSIKSLFSFYALNRDCRYKPAPAVFQTKFYPHNFALCDTDTPVFWQLSESCLCSNLRFQIFRGVSCTDLPSEGAGTKKAVAHWYYSLCQLNIYSLHSYTALTQERLHTEDGQGGMMLFPSSRSLA